MMNRAIDLLPAGLKPFFDRYRDELVLRVNDPDLCPSTVRARAGAINVGLLVALNAVPLDADAESFDSPLVVSQSKDASLAGDAGRP